MRTMIFDKLDCKIKKMKELRRLEEIKANKAQQDATDVKYRLLLMQVHQFVDVINYTHEHLQFVLSDSVLNDINGLLDNLRGAVKTGYSNKDTVADAETSFKNIQTTVRKDWGKHFNTITATTISTLRVISGIDEAKVSSCLDVIKAAEIWTSDKKNFVNLEIALKDAEGLIQSLSLDQEIITFLKNMNAGKASIADLNDKVIAWIQKESLASKIKLSFSNR